MLYACIKYIFQNYFRMNYVFKFQRSPLSKTCSSIFKEIFKEFFWYSINKRCYYESISKYSTKIDNFEAILVENKQVPREFIKEDSHNESAFPEIERFFTIYSPRVPKFMFRYIIEAILNNHHDKHRSSLKTLRFYEQGTNLLQSLGLQSIATKTMIGILLNDGQLKCAADLFFKAFMASNLDEYDMTTSLSLLFAHCKRNFHADVLHSIIYTLLNDYAKRKKIIPIYVSAITSNYLHAISEEGIPYFIEILLKFNEPFSEGSKKLHYEFLHNIMKFCLKNGQYYRSISLMLTYKDLWSYSLETESKVVSQTFERYFVTNGIENLLNIIPSNAPNHLIEWAYGDVLKTIGNGLDRESYSLIISFYGTRDFFNFATLEGVNQIDSDCENTEKVTGFLKYIIDNHDFEPVYNSATLFLLQKLCEKHQITSFSRFLVANSKKEAFSVDNLLYYCNILKVYLAITSKDLNTSNFDRFLKMTELKYLNMEKLHLAFMLNHQLFATNDFEMLNVYFNSSFFRKIVFFGSRIRRFKDAQLNVLCESPYYFSYWQQDHVLLKMVPENTKLIHLKRIFSTSTLSLQQILHFYYTLIDKHPKLAHSSIKDVLNVVLQRFRNIVEAEKLCLFIMEKFPSANLAINFISVLEWRALRAESSSITQFFKSYLAIRQKIAASDQLDVLGAYFLLLTNKDLIEENSFSSKLAKLFKLVHDRLFEEASRQIKRIEAEHFDDLLQSGFSLQKMKRAISFYGGCYEKFIESNFISDGCLHPAAPAENANRIKSLIKTGRVDEARILYKKLSHLIVQSSFEDIYYECLNACEALEIAEKSNYFTKDICLLEKLLCRAVVHQKKDYVEFLLSKCAPNKITPKMQVYLVQHQAFEKNMHQAFVLAEKYFSQFGRDTDIGQRIISSLAAHSSHSWFTNSLMPMIKTFSLQMTPKAYDRLICQLLEECNYKAVEVVICEMHKNQTSIYASTVEKIIETAKYFSIETISELLQMVKEQNIQLSRSAFKNLITSFEEQVPDFFGGCVDAWTKVKSEDCCVELFEALLSFLLSRNFESEFACYQAICMFDFMQKRRYVLTNEAFNSLLCIFADGNDEEHVNHFLAIQKIFEDDYILFDQTADRILRFYIRRSDGVEATKFATHLPQSTQFSHEVHFFLQNFASKNDEQNQNQKREFYLKKLEENNLPFCAANLNGLFRAFPEKTAQLCHWIERRRLLPVPNFCLQAAESPAKRRLMLTWGVDAAGCTMPVAFQIESLATAGPRHRKVQPVCVRRRRPVSQ